MVEDMLEHVRGPYGESLSSGHPLRFILLTTPRSGTMMLANALEADPAVRLWNLYASNPKEPHVSLALWEGFQWGEYPPEVTHLGTTMHFVGAAWSPRSPIPLARLWSMLAAKHDRYLILYRENLVRQYLSYQVGIALGTYDVLKPRSEKPEPPPVTFDLQKFTAWVADIRWLLQLANLFPSRLQLSYELLSRQWNAVYRTVRDYLGLPKIADAPSPTYKQESRTLHEAITNYDEVATWCKTDGHEEWMEDPA